MAPPGRRTSSPECSATWRPLAARVCALFAARVIGAWTIVLAILAATATAIGVLSIALADSAPAPHAATLIAGTAAILVAGALSAAMTVGLSALVGSRGVVIGVLLAFFLAIEPLLSLVGFLGDARQGLPAVAIDRIGHTPIPGNVEVALGTAIAVAIAWGITTLGVGAWKTTTREI